LAQVENSLADPQGFKLLAFEEATGNLLFSVPLATPAWRQ
jgi:hypothetical protein